MENETMDKRIEKKKGFRTAFTRKALPYWGGALFLILVLWIVFRDNSSTLRVDGQTLTTGDVTQGEFNDYIRISGQVQPMTTIQISPLEGGVVEEIIREEGSQVKKGDEILRLSNENLDLQILNSEAELAEKENLLRNTMISMEQQKLSVKQERLQLQMEERRNKRAYEQMKALYEEKLIAREEWLKAEEDYLLTLDKLELVKNRELQDSLYRSVEIEQMQESLDNMKVNMQMIRADDPQAQGQPHHKGSYRRGARSPGRSPRTVHRLWDKDRTDKRPVKLQDRGADRRALHRQGDGRPGSHIRKAERVFPCRNQEGLSGGEGREIQGRLQVLRTAAGQHPHRTDLLHEPAAGTS